MIQKNLIFVMYFVLIVTAIPWQLTQVMAAESPCFNEINMTQGKSPLFIAIHQADEDAVRREIMKDLAGVVRPYEMIYHGKEAAVNCWTIFGGERINSIRYAKALAQLLGPDAKRDKIVRILKDSEIDELPINQWEQGLADSKAAEKKTTPITDQKVKVLAPAQDTSKVTAPGHSQGVQLK
jgi:hypothetical protein